MNVILLRLSQNVLFYRTIVHYCNIVTCYRRRAKISFEHCTPRSFFFFFFFFKDGPVHHVCACTSANGCMQSYHAA